jgi:hypothetical protein
MAPTACQGEVHSAADISGSIGADEEEGGTDAQFVEEECEIGSELSWQRDPCYAHYVACCEASNNKPLSRPKFVEAMEDLNLGIKCRRFQAAPGETKRPYVFVGIGKLGKARHEATMLKMSQPGERETSRASAGSGDN